MKPLAWHPGFAMGRGGVDDRGGPVLHHGDGLDGGLVGQAEEGDVGGVERLGTCGRVLSAVIGKRDELQVAAR